MQYSLLGDQLALGHGYLSQLLAAASPHKMGGGYLIKNCILILKGMDHVYSSVGFTLLNIFGLALYLEVRIFSTFRRIFLK